MEVSQLYKNSEIGIIPQDWKVVRLKDCLLRSPEYGINAPAVKFDENLPTYIRITDITEEGYFSSNDKVSVNHHDSSRYFLEKGDIVFARTGASVGKSYLYAESDGGLVFAGFLIRIKLDSSKLIPIYLANFVKTKCFWDWVRIMSMRSGQPGINGKEYAQLLLPLPPLPEQQAIAKVLSDVDALIASLDALIAKKRAIKQGVMQELLTGKTRLPGFNGGWEEQPLEKLGSITGSGVDKKIHSNESAVRLLNFMDIYSNSYIFLSDLHQTVTAPNYKIHDCSILKGDIFFTPSSEMPYDIGISAVAMEDINNGVYSYHIVRYRLNETNNWDLLFRSFIFKTSFFLDQAKKVCAGSGQRYVISLASFKSLDIEIKKLGQQRMKMQVLKQGMMQELLTGRIRLLGG
jgi:type I restriction enzyme S subunit